LSLSWLDAVVILVALIVIAIVLGYFDLPRAAESLTPMEPPASQIGDWTFESTIRERQMRYLVKRMLMERIAHETEDEIVSTVKVWALYYDIDDAYALCVAQRESSFDQAAIGDDGNAVGLWQFWLPTWEIFRKKMNASVDDQRDNLQESTRTAMWAFANGYARHWAPVKKGLCVASE